MSRLSLSEVQGVRTSLNNEMKKHLPAWKDQANFISPKRIKDASNNSQKVDGRRKDENILNNQAGRSLRTFVSGMMNGATPRSRPWFNLVSATPGRKTSSEISRYYKQVEKVLNDYFQLSNLYRVLPLAYKDVGVFSNAAFAMLPDAVTGFHFYPFAVGTYAFATDSKGRTNMFTRDFTMNVRQVVETYANRDPVTGAVVWNNIPASVKAFWDAKQYVQEIVMTQTIVPNANYSPKKESFDPADKKFQSYTYVTGTGSNGVTPQNPTGFRQENNSGVGTRSDQSSDQEFLKVGGFNYFPIITPRWEVEPEGYYGIDGPGDLALSDIKTLQKEEYYRFEAIEKLVRPPMVGHSSLRRHASSILAGGITYVDDRGMAHGFKSAFDLNPQLSELISSKEEIQSYIKTAFYEDLFRQLSSEKKISHVTEAEINQRSAETLAALAPVLGQWDHDTTGPIIENGLFMLEEQGKLPPKPAELEKDSLKPEYISILAQASKASSITTQEQFIGFVSATAKALEDPNILAIANAEAQVRLYAENAAIDPTTILNEKEYKSVVEVANQVRAQQLAQQNADQAAQRNKTLSETPIGQGSALDQVV